jgi:NSS family neurotransmitter:Na+ symporter
MAGRRFGWRKAGAAPAQSGVAEITERWSSPRALVLAASGAAIGYNNFWQFPVLLNEHGGGAFLIVYLFLATAIGLPLLVAELLVGQQGRGSPPASFERLAGRAGAGERWALAGWLGVAGGFLIFSYLSVIAGWTLAYTARSALGVLSGQTADGLGSLFAGLVHDPEKQLFWYSLFVGLTLYAAGRGVRRGVEPVLRYAVALLFALLALLLGYAATTEAFAPTLEQLFLPDFTRFTPRALLAAVTHAFFSLGLGVGAMLMYGAYAGAPTRVPRVALTVVAADTLAGVAGAVVVVAVLDSGGVALTAGPELVFQAVPLAFDHLPYGQLFATLFLAVLVLAAWASGFALVEPLLARLCERHRLSRAHAATVTGVAAWLLGLVMMLSFDRWAFGFRFLGSVKQLGLFDVAQLLSAQLLLPLTGILTALFAGWSLKSEDTRAALALRSPCSFDLWLWLVRVAIPVSLAIMFLNLGELFA